MKNWAIVIGAYLVYLAMTYGVARLLNLAQAKLYLFLGILAVLGLAAIALYVYLKGKKDELDAGGGAAEAGGASEAEQLIRAASARLIQSKAAGGAGISNLPLVFVMGDRNSAKTSVILHSGLEPELLAGQIYGENNAVAPTRAANIWFARGTAFVEAGGQLLADPSNWVKLVKKLSPGAWKSLVGGGGRAPRAVLLCFDVENFLRQGAAEEIAAATRYLQARLGEVSETLGIRYPVYVLFTRADRLPFFADYVRTLNNEEANQVFGATLPMSLSANLGLYAEEESKRLSIAFNNLFHSLCDKRLHFLPREGDPEKLPGTYEFPREFRKLRNSLVQFLVEVCRPSQLRASPFLRGFYFSGVRPITVADIPPPVAAPQQETLQASGGATRMFRVGMEAELKAKQAMAQAQSQGRRVPQWLFLGHLFHSVILNDTPALQASGSSVKTSMLQRVLLAAAASLLLIYGGLLTVSFFQNRALENRIAAAANDLKAAGALVQGFPDEAGLRKLETLRAALEELVRYQKEGRPTMMGWGLWTGDALLAPARKAYYGRFRDLLFGQTQAGMLAFLNSRPDVPAPTDDYGYGYDTLKSYLLTTSEWQRSSDPNLEKFLAARLYDRWKQDKDAEIGQARLELAKKQFDFYAWDLKNGNPYSTNTDTNAVTKTRIYLSKFTGIDRFYQALLALADAKGPAVSFNQKYPGSGEVLISPVPVRYAFTKAGWDFLKGQIENANIGGEPWVLGEYLGQIPPKDQLKSAILERYTADFIKQWREVLKKSSVVRYASFPDAARKLGKLSSPQTPLLGLMWWTSTNTGLNDLPKVVNAFQAVHKVVPPAQQELYIVDPNRNYNSALITLQGSFERAGPNPNPAAFTQANNDAISARGVAQQLIATFPPDTEAQLDKDVARLLLQPIEGVNALQPDVGSGARSFCAAWEPLTRKFPFNPTAQPEVTLQELGDILRPQTGRLWQLYETQIKQVLECQQGNCSETGAMPVNPRFVAFISNMMKFSRALYGDSGADPNYKYSIRAIARAPFDGYDIKVNGEAVKLSGGQTKAAVWPGASPQFSIALRVGNASLPTGHEYQGLWSVFRFFAYADRSSGSNFIWTNRSGQQGRAGSEYELQVDAGGNPVVFSKQFLSTLKCESKVLAK